MFTDVTRNSMLIRSTPTGAFTTPPSFGVLTDGSKTSKEINDNSATCWQSEHVMNATWCERNLQSLLQVPGFCQGQQWPMAANLSEAAAAIRIIP